MRYLELLGRSQSILGIDIGHSGINVVEIDRKAKSPTVKAIARSSVRPDAFNGYLIKDPARMGQELAELLRGHGITTRRAVAALPSPVVFTKIISVSKAPRSELAELIRTEVANVIPFRIDSVKFDYQVLRVAAHNRLEVLIVAAKCDAVENLLQTLAAAELETVVVDVDACAIQNSFYNSSATDHRGTVVALLHIGASFTAVTVCKDQEILLCGDLPTHWTGEMSEAQCDGLATKLHQELTQRLIAEGRGEQASLIVLSGEASRHERLRAKIADVSGVLTTIADPLRGFRLIAGMNPGEGQRPAPDMAVALGLAVREAGDKVFPKGA